MKMPRSKIEAFYREFPWLEKLVKIDPCICINVQRIDLELFRKKLKRFNIEGLFSSYHQPAENMYALNEKGEVLGQVGYKKLERKPTFWQKLTCSYYTLYLNNEEALEDLFRRLDSQGTVSQVAFVLSVCTQYLGGDLIRYVTIYKAPKDMSVYDYLEQEIAIARVDVKKEIDRV